MLHQQNRVFDDLYEAERNKRKAAENGTQALQDLLRVIAVRIDGIRYEQMCKEDPTIPARWSIGDWKQYFLSVQPTELKASAGWGGQMLEVKATDSKNEEIAHLRAAQAKLQAQLDETLRELENLKNTARKYPRKDKLVAVPVSAAPNGDKTALFAKPFPRNGNTKIVDLAPEAQALGDPSSYTGILIDFGEFLTRLGPPPPAYAPLTADGRSWQRYAGMVYLLGKWGITAKIEIDAVVAQINGISSGSGSLRNTLDKLTDYKYLTTEILTLDKVGVALRFYRLSLEGSALYRAITGEDAVESEWTSVLACRENGLSEENTCACLAFTLHARRRGWGAKLQPGTGDQPAVIILVTRSNACIHVAIPLSDNVDEKPVWLRNFAQTNGGLIAVCTATPDLRNHLANYCHEEKLPGMATDLATLMAPGYTKISINDELWLETWSAQS